MRIFLKILAVYSCCFLSSCNISMSKEDKIRNVLSTPDLSKSTETALESSVFSSGTWPEETWWQQYGLQELNELVEQGLLANPTIQSVEQKLSYAKSEAVIKRAALLPLVYFDTSDQWQYLSKNGIYRALNPKIPLSSSEIDFSLSFFYEFDFWSKYRNLYRASLAKVEAAKAETAQAKLITSTAIAQSYFALRTNLIRKNLYLQLYKVRKAYFDLQNQMRDKALYSALEPLLSQEDLFQAEQFIENIDQEIAVNIHTVNILAGRGPDTIIYCTEDLLPLSSSLIIPNEVSSELLSRRPDLMAQKWLTEALAYEVGAAKAEFFPDINISSILGFQSGSWSNLWDWASKTLGLSPGLSLPVYTAGAIGSNVDAKHALFSEAVFQYNNLILLSFSQVADLLSIGKSVFVEKQKQEQIVNNAKARYGLTKLRRNSGIDNSLTAYQYLEQLISQQLQDAELLYQQYLVSISLVKSLGGGYVGQVRDL